MDDKRLKKDIDIEPGKRVRLATEDVLAIGGVVVSIIIALGIVFRAVDATAGVAIIVPLLGLAGIAKYVKAKRSSRSH